MSIAWLTTCWDTELGNSTSVQKSGGAVSGASARKLVLLVLADHADEDGFCWPSVRLISDRSELSDRAVRKALTTLEEDGFIEVEEDFETAGRQTSNVYRLTVNSESPLVSGTRGRVNVGLGGVASGTTPTRTVSRTTRRNRKELGGENTRPVRKVEADEVPSAEESPSLGADRRRKVEKTKTEVADLAMTRSLFGVAKWMREELIQQGFVGPVNKEALVRQVKSWDLPLEVVREMVSLFVANPKRYLRGDEVAWTGFVRQREALLADAKKGSRWKLTTEVESPYAS